MLTKTQKDAIRGMLADKQSVKTIAEELEVDVEDVEALKPPKAVRLATLNPNPQPSPPAPSCYGRAGPMRAAVMP